MLAENDLIKSFIDEDPQMSVIVDKMGEFEEDIAPTITAVTLVATLAGYHLARGLSEFISGDPVQSESIARTTTAVCLSLGGGAVGISRYIRLLLAADESERTI